LEFGHFITYQTIELMYSHLPDSAKIRLSMATYQPTIGLEIHAELRTSTKMFCSSKNDADEIRANVNICPVCMSHPGTLPVINKEAVKHVLRVGAALKSRLADYTEFDRKNYFYPDLPKGYQLSQFAFPLVSGGELAGVQITRVHLEEDTASSMHDESTATTTIDYNRAGVPLMELVTEPVITSAEQAGDFARELQLLLRALGVSNANMEKGEMRVEANVSLAKDGVQSSSYVELKNINSFNAMERAVRYELERQKSVLESGGTIEKETRGWDESKQQTFSQRSKEGSADYRYFPDPDLPSLRLSEIEDMNTDSLVATLPILPQERREKYIAAGIKAEDARAFVQDVRLGDFLDEVSKHVPSAYLPVAGNYIANDLVKIVRDIEQRESSSLSAMPISAINFAQLIQLVSDKKISSKTAKTILLRSVESGTEPAAIARDENLLQTTDTTVLVGVIDMVLAANPGVVSDFKAGKGAALEYLLGQCMREMRGVGDPEVLRGMLQEKMR